MYLFPSPERWLIKVWKILYKNVRSSILCKFFYATFAGITKGGKTWDTKTLNLSRNIVSWHVLVDISRFSPYMINLPRNETFVVGCKKHSAGLLWATNFGFVAHFSSTLHLVMQQICSCWGASWRFLYLVFRHLNLKELGGRGDYGI